MYIKTRLLLALFSLGCALCVSAEVYKTVDKNGHVTYTDVPPADNQGKPVELKSINTLPKPPDIPIQTPPPVTPTQEYQVQILSPANGTTLLASERSVDITAGLNGLSLPEGMSLAYKLDGNLIKQTGETLITLNDPPAGEHKITVELLDNENEMLAQSEAVTLLVMRPIFKQPNVTVPKK